MAEYKADIDKSSMLQGPDGEFSLEAIWQTVGSVVVIPLAILVLMPVLAFSLWGMYTVITAWGLFFGLTVGLLLVGAFTVALYALVMCHVSMMLLSGALSAVVIYFIATGT